jgi:predicted extracellular nuclease
MRPHQPAWGVFLRALIAFAFVVSFSVAAPRAFAVSDTLVISQIYGGGGNSGATYTNDFIELFNRGTTAVDITGWSVQYASATGSSWQKTALSGTLQPGQYYLVQEAQGLGGTQALPAPDATGTIAMSATAGKVALVSNNTTLSGSCPAGVVDFVGFGSTANCFEGSGPAPAPSNSTAALRNDSGATDTDNNSADFSTGAPNPRNSGSPPPSTSPCQTAPAITKISALQGTTDTTPCAGMTVAVEAVVIGDYEGASPALRGFYIEEEAGDQDADPQTSEGVFVFNGNNDTVSLGDTVRVTGTVSEFQGQTQISASAVQVVGSGSVAPVDVTLPFPSADYAERYEGMLVRFPQTLYVTEHYQLGRFGQVVMSSESRLRQPTNVVAPGAAARALQAENDLNRIIVDDDLNNQNPDPIKFGRGGQPLSASNTLRGGDTVTGMVGVLTYTWAGNNASGNAYRLRPVGALGGGAPDFQPTNLRPATAPNVGGSVRVAGMNLLNFFNTFDGLPDTVDNCTYGVGGAPADCRGADTPEEFARQWPKTVAAVTGTGADIIGVIEIENDGYGPDSAIQFLVDKLNEATAPGTYTFIDVDAATGQINALGTDAIKVGLIYKPAVVTPVGTTAVLNSDAFVTGGDSAPRNRPSLAQAFVENATGGRFIVDVNHLKSKGSACDAPDAGDGQGNCNQVRVNAANLLTQWLASDPTGTGDPDVLIVGDLNSYAKEDPIAAIESAGYTNLIAQFNGADAYSYVFDGQWGYLDHALGSNSLTSQITGVADWHINADEPSVLDYNTDFKSADQISSLYAPDQFRVSDHDPVIVGLNPVNHPPEAGDDSATVKKNGSVRIAVLSNDHDADGDALTVTAVAGGNRKGTITINHDGTITYAPKPGFKGVDSFTYTVSDGYGTATATVTVTVTNK